MRISWELGARTDESAYRDEVAVLHRELEGLCTVREQPTAAQGRTLTTLVDRWDEMDAGQRRRLVSTVFEEITRKGGRLEAVETAPGLASVHRAIDGAQVTPT
jgi:hypothetical protein